MTIRKKKETKLLRNSTGEMRFDEGETELDQEMLRIKELLKEVRLGLERNDATHDAIIVNINKIQKDNESSFLDVRNHMMKHWRLSLLAALFGLSVALYRLLSY